jgi:hypothetical protein
MSFQISDHILEIERGRYNQINTEQRMCRQCHLNVIEDNFNFPFNLLKLSLPDEGYVRSASCVLHKISTFEYFQK